MSELSETVAVDMFTYALIKIESSRLKISEEELIALAWSEYVRNHARQFRLAFLRRPWYLFKPEGRRLLARTFG